MRKNAPEIKMIKFADADVTSANFFVKLNVKTENLHKEFII
jgi:hypothetical protein